MRGKKCYCEIFPCNGLIFYFPKPYLHTLKKLNISQSDSTKYFSSLNCPVYLFCFLTPPPQRRPTHWPILKFRRGSGRPSYAEVEAPGQDGDSTVVIDPKQSFVIADRRESEQKEGFIIPDQRERFLSSESCWPKLQIPPCFGTELVLWGHRLPFSDATIYF